MNFRAVQISGSTCFLTMQLVDCFEACLAEQNRSVLFIGWVSKSVPERLRPSSMQATYGTSDACPSFDSQPSSAVPAGLSLEMEFSHRRQSPSSQANEFSAADLMRPNVATAGVPQDQLIFQLDVLRLGFVARLTAMAVDELIEE
jgi:hypothetical protein